MGVDVMMPSLIRVHVKNLIESSPRLWQLAWWVLNKVPLLLPHDPSYRGLLHMRLETAALVLDVGANSGISALYFLRIFPQAQILSFEPSAAHEARLSAIQRKKTRFCFKSVALGEREGDITIYTPAIGRIALHTFSSADDTQLRSVLAKTYGKEQLKRIKIESETCQVTTIDAMGLQPGFVKIDAEGHELQILRGARSTLQRSRPILLFEASHADLEEIGSLLSALQFAMLDFDPGTDRFQMFGSRLVPYVSGARNLYAVPCEKLSALKLPGLT
jgi:FkbM family methyltransferase